MPKIKPENVWRTSAYDDIYTPTDPDEIDSTLDNWIVGLACASLALVILLLTFTF